MAQKGRIPKASWTQELAKELANDGSYIIVGKRGTRKITTALRQWKKSEHAKDCYLPLPYQVVGSAEDITTFLKSQNKTDAEIKNLLSSAYTAQSVESHHKEAFEKELASATKPKRNAKKDKSEPSDDDKLKELDDLVKDLSDMKEQTFTKRSKKDALKSKRMSKTLLQRVTNATEKNKVIDVSNWKDGEGYREVRVVTKPPPGTAKIYVDGLALVSSNEETYVRALDELGDDYQHFLPEYQKAAAAFKEAEAAKEANPVPVKRIRKSKKTTETSADEPKEQDKVEDVKEAPKAEVAPEPQQAEAAPEPKVEPVQAPPKAKATKGSRKSSETQRDVPKEPPKVEAPPEPVKAEVPKEPVKTEAPKVETPKAEVPKPEAPVKEPPSVLKALGKLNAPKAAPATSVPVPKTPASTGKGLPFLKK